MPDSEPLVRFASELVRIPSVLGSEEAMAARVADEMRRLGFDLVEIDAVGNVVGVVAGEGRGPTVLFDAHMDTVDVVPREAWSVDPFGGEVAGSRLWGRGAADMKGSLAAIVHAIAGIGRRDLTGRLVVVASVEEERLEGAALASVCERHRPDAVVIGEASDLHLVRAGRGRAELVLETRGRPAHASTPELGANAIERMMRVAGEIEALPLPEHPFVGRGVVCLTDIISEPYPAHSVVPSGCRATLERRLVPGETRDGVLAEVRSACERAGVGEARVTLARARLETWTGHALDEEKWLPPWELPEDHAVVRSARRALADAGLPDGTTAYGFCTNAAHTAGVAGIPTVGFGPGREDLAHVVDEFLEIDQLIAARRGYMALARALTVV